MQKLVFPMRETMPQFVCSLRQVDEWKKFQAKQSVAMAQAAYDLHAKYVKSPFAKSLKIDDVLRFLDDTALDVEFMVQLPSIEKCLEQWWKLYAQAPSMHVVDQDQLRQVYYDLANALVEAKTENMHKNSVSMIMRASWTKWSARDPPLTQSEFFRLLFVLAHLMTESSRLGDYVLFFQETLAKITRAHQSKAKRIELRKRKPRVHRKSSVVEIMGKSGVVRMHLGARASVSTAPGTAAEGGGGGSDHQRPHSVVSVSLPSSRTMEIGADSAYVDDTSGGCEDRFVEVLDRRGVYARHGATQHVVLDPLLLARPFQDKWRRPAHAATLSTDDALCELHPVTNKYVPPLCIARLKATKAGRQCQSTPALQLKQTRAVDDDERDEAGDDSRVKDARELEVLRRSQSMVTLQRRIEHNKATAKQTERRHKKKKQEEEEEQATPIYLAIST